MADEPKTDSCWHCNAPDAPYDGFRYVCADERGCALRQQALHSADTTPPLDPPLARVLREIDASLTRLIPRGDGSFSSQPYRERAAYVRGLVYAARMLAEGYR